MTVLVIGTLHHQRIWTSLCGVSAISHSVTHGSLGVVGWWGGGLVLK